MPKRKLALLLLTASAIFLPSLSSADSQVRIVRLSFVDGAVQIDRRDGRGFEPAILNMPVVAGARLRTGNDGRAEVEFEKGSTIRLSPESALEFAELGRHDSGQPATSVRLHEGTAYFNVREKDGEAFSIEVGRREIRPHKSVRFRLQVQGTEAKLAVFKGDLKVAEGAADNWIAVRKNETLALDLDDATRQYLAKEISSYPDDRWDKKRDEYRDDYGSSSNLSYYGRYTYVPPYGYLWRPALASAAWDPFADGAWVWYPGFGYMWVSAYAWGWTPYHYGSWLFVPTYGWCWNPRGGGTNWSNAPAVLDPPPGFNPPRPPAAGGGGVVVVGRGPNPSVGGRRPILDDLERSSGGSSGRRTGPPQGGSAASQGRSAGDASPSSTGPGRSPAPDSGRSNGGDARSGRGQAGSSHAAPRSAPMTPGASSSHSSMGGVGSSRPSAPSSMGGSSGSFGGSHSAGSGSHSGHSGSQPRSNNPR